MLSEGNQAQKTTCYMTPFVENFQKKASLWRQKGDQWLPGSRIGTVCEQMGTRGLIWHDGNFLKLDCGAGQTSV